MDKDDIKISGLKYVPDFISIDEEEDLLKTINNETWLTDLKRRVQHYGWEYDYKTRSINYSMFLGQLPDWTTSITKKLVQLDYFLKPPDQLIINEYKVGQGIANHIDCEPCFDTVIASISLGSSCVMDFTNLKSKEKIEVLLEHRSIVVLSAEARYNWMHGIVARKTDFFKETKIERKLRISMTFRNVILTT